MTLDELSLHRQAVITHLSFDEASLSRLRSRGLCPGSRVTLHGSFPGGQVLVIGIGHRLLALRRENAARMTVSPAYPSSSSAVPPLRFLPDAPIVTAETARIALVGNPNCGKSTLFNALTGSHQHVGNFPGVTVEKKEGALRGHPDVTVVDLPGLYGLEAPSGDERVARDYLRTSPPSLIVNVLDSSSLAAGLCLTLPLLTLGIPAVLALNMCDEVRAAGGELFPKALAEALGVPVIPISAKTGEGIRELTEAVTRSLRSPSVRRPLLPEGDALPRLASHLADRTCRLPEKSDRVSDRLDTLFIGRLTAFPLFFLLMSLVFLLTFVLIGRPLGDRLADGITLLSEKLRQGLHAAGASDFLLSLVCDGLLQGIGCILGFLPVVLILNTLLSLLEDCGYLARVACLFDAPLRRLGLSGKSIVPMLIGFGCTVPAVMACRTLEGDAEKKKTAFLCTFMSCTAKLPLFGYLASRYFSGHEGLFLLFLYGLGVLSAILVALLLKLFTKKTSDDGLFLMELPPYRFPDISVTMRGLVQKTGEFIRRTVTVIPPSIFVLWYFSHVDRHLVPTSLPSDSLLAALSAHLAPLFRLPGFDDWRITSSLISGFLDKETILSSLHILYGGLEAFRTSLPFTSAMPFAVFCLFYAPCIAAVGTIRRETGGKTALFSVLFQTLFGYTAAVVLRAALLCLF